jgi:hypothetical protein
MVITFYLESNEIDLKNMSWDQYMTLRVNKFKPEANMVKSSRKSQ